VTSALRCRRLPNGVEQRLSLTVRALDDAILYRRLISIAPASPLTDGSRLASHLAPPPPLDSLHPSSAYDLQQNRVLYVENNASKQLRFAVMTERDETLQIVRFGFKGASGGCDNSFQEEIRVNREGQIPNYSYASPDGVAFSFNRSERLHMLSMVIARVRAQHTGVYWATFIGETDYSQAVEFVTDIIVKKVAETKSLISKIVRDARSDAVGSRSRYLHVRLQACSDVTYIAIYNTFQRTQPRVNESRPQGDEDNTVINMHISEDRNKESPGRLFLSATVADPHASSSNVTNFQFCNGVPNCVICRGEGWPRQPSLQLHRGDGTLLGSEESHSVYWYRESARVSIVTLLIRRPNDEYSGGYVCTGSSYRTGKESQYEGGGGERGENDIIARFTIRVV